MPLIYVVLPQKCIFCSTDFGSTIALDLQHKGFLTFFSWTNGKGNASFSWNL